MNESRGWERKTQRQEKPSSPWWPLAFTAPSVFSLWWLLIFFMLLLLPHHPVTPDVFRRRWTSCWKFTSGLGEKRTSLTRLMSSSKKDISRRCQPRTEQHKTDTSTWWERWLEKHHQAARGCLHLAPLFFLNLHCSSPAPVHLCLWSSSTIWCYTVCLSSDWWGRSSASERGLTSLAWRCSRCFSFPFDIFSFFLFFLDYYLICSGENQISFCVLAVGAGKCEAEPSSHVCHHWQAAFTGAAGQVKTHISSSVALLCNRTTLCEKYGTAISF